MTVASIDIGTNTVLLLVAELREGQLIVLDEKERIPQLGKGVDKARNLHPNSVQRVLDVLNEYKSFLELEYPETVPDTIVTATSAVRDASNREEFMQRVQKETSWTVQLLSGLEEAQTTYKGALAVLDGRANHKNLVLDIGGGSSELAIGDGHTLIRAVSLDMGSVRFTERFFRTDPPIQEDIQTASDEIQDLLQNEEPPNRDVDLIGVAGTVTALAGIALGLTSKETKQMIGHRISKTIVQEFIDEFSVTPSNQIEEKYPIFLHGRGEVVLAGILILREVMKWSGQDSIITSTGGIRHGILLKSMVK